MNLVSTNPGKNSCLVWLKFSDGSLLPLKIDDLHILSLKKNVEITPDLFKRIQELSFAFMLSEYAIRQVAISPKTSKILLPKLQQYCYKMTQKFGYPPCLYQALIDATLKKLENDGLLDGSQYADYFIRRHPKMSQAQITYSLRQLGLTVPADLSFPDGDKIKAILKKKYSNVNFSDYRSRNKVIAGLSRHGFAINDIKTAIDDR
jgi:SOS response regulatory protein OraA/RecX